MRSILTASKISGLFMSARTNSGEGGTLSVGPKPIIIPTSDASCSDEVIRDPRHGTNSHPASPSTQIRPFDRTASANLALTRAAPAGRSFHTRTDAVMPLINENNMTATSVNVSIDFRLLFTTIVAPFRPVRSTDTPTPATPHSSHTHA